MPKTLPLDPTQLRQSGWLEAPRLPLNRYRPDPQAEMARYGAPTLRGIYRDMLYIRSFEAMLDAFKTQGVYQGLEYSHKGPAHLSIGQEAAAVGLCLPLGPEDFIFGSHRSHGEILAKGFGAIAQLGEAELASILETYQEGRILRVVERHPHQSLQERALDYLLYGLLAEIFGRDTGFNRGMGGSMHAFFPPFGILPNNAIVGGSADIAVGAALYKRVARQPGICVASIGDAALGCGPTWEAMTFASMDQYRSLWPAEVGGAPPVLFNFMNNFYGMGGQTLGETMGFGVLARVGLGVNPQALHAERVDGFNPLAVAEAVERKKALLLAGQGPALLDTLTYRYSGHSPSDASSYRDKSEIEAWQAQDALEHYAGYLIAQGLMTQEEQEALQWEAQERLRRIAGWAISDSLSPRLPPNSEQIAQWMFSRRPSPARAEGPPWVEKPLPETRYGVLQSKHRSGLDEAGRPLPKLKCLTYAEALTEALFEALYTDPSLIAYGEENRDWGGAFGVYRGLTEALPYPRLFNAPISEAAIVGTAVGYALSGGRVVVELMYCDFMGRAGDEIFNQMAKWQAMSGGVLELPLVLRVSVGSKYGAQHSQDWSSLVAHIPGLQVMYPATPYDAKGMLTLALQGSDPVVFFESQRLYGEPETLVPGGVPLGSYQVPLGQPAVRRPGQDITLISLGPALYRALEAAQRLQAYGLEAEVLDLRFLNPLDYTPLVDSVRKTGRALLVSEACERGSFLHTVASNLSQLAFDHLDAPIVVLGARNWITPPAELEDLFFPSADWIVDAVHERILPLPGHQPRTAQATHVILERNQLGV
ncbi:thiamine pyrophosphate-dependent enzyme [Meiothermus sp.]|uniref:alpha-ketoacid dehydrogenase subunit alpha/beta n=1 Tax=Meiothermus sp. TaxID=1955249 RepID=UPI00307D9AAC